MARLNIKDKVIGAAVAAIVAGSIWVYREAVDTVRVKAETAKRLDAHELRLGQHEQRMNEMEKLQAVAVETQRGVEGMLRELKDESKERGREARKGKP